MTDSKRTPTRADPTAHTALDTSTPDYGDLAAVLTGGGARGAYQVGVLRAITRQFPELRIPVLVGVSAGAVNATYIANHAGSLPQAVEDLARLWTSLTPDQVFRVDGSELVSNGLHWLVRLGTGGRLEARSTRGLVDTAPLQAVLERSLGASVDEPLSGIGRNLERGTLRALALGTTNYATGQTIVWVQGSEIETWERPKRRSVQAPITIGHLMASAALPLFFPAVRVGSYWYGDGGLRMTAPLSPALHLGADKILAVSTRYQRSQAEADRPEVVGYPPPAQILGVMYNAIFLDLIDQDVLRLERMNRLLAKLPPDDRDGMRIVDILVLRPSQDLGRLAREYEPRLPSMFRWLTRGLGTRQASSADLLSLLMFQEDYLARIIALGEADGHARASEIADFIKGTRTVAGVER
ncbi:MAG TPA: patatin-like phospholipase family protein [Gemmatimonadaceae bacterium]|nr:patatin-like phospholipase family protein [Gemmatimonadaceae bacterium]